MLISKLKEELEFLKTDWVYLASKLVLFEGKNEPVYRFYHQEAVENMNRRKEIEIILNHAT